MSTVDLKNILEALLMTADAPMDINRLAALSANEQEPVEKSAIREALQRLQDDYAGRGIELKEVASGFRIQVRSEYAEWVNRLFDEKPQRYSRALLETLAIIAYRQPVTRGEIEEIRGVSVNSNIIRTLQERDWIKVVGHRDVPGKPELLATTREFLDYFNLKKLSDLPPLSDIRDLDNINPDLFEGIEGFTDQALADEDTAAETEQDAVNDPGVNPDTDSNVVPFSG